MHGISYTLIPTIISEPIPTFTDGPAVEARNENLGGMRNLLPLDPSKAFGQISDQSRLRDLIRKLAARIGREKPWPDLLPDAIDASDNPRIPSGYTYFLQLIAHDLVNTSISLAATRGRQFGFHNARVQPLSLDTIFGGGPDVCPHAYEYSEDCSAYLGFVPRTRLRVGRSRVSGGGTDGQPFNDIGRAAPIDVRDSGVPATKNVNQCLRTDALIADPRNDDHALISQLTLLWHRLHNFLVGAIEDSLIGRPPVERAYHSFILSRFVVTFIYRKIILYDVLDRLLHPIVFKHYVLDRKPLATVIDGQRGIPVEFAHGAFRCGHVMIRDRYRVRSDKEEPTDQALMFTSQRSPGFVPVTEEWVVNWERFFPINGGTTALNYSRRLGPNFSGVAKNSTLFGALVSDQNCSADPPGLHSRDLVSSAFANMWSVPSLVDALRAQSSELANFLPPYSDYKIPLVNWLESQPGSAEGLQFVKDDVELIAEDPPLPFFVLFEASLADSSSGLAFRGGGQHLGPLGSVIVAETILGAASESPLQTGVGELDPHKPFAEAASKLVRMGLNPGVAARIPEIRSMPELLNFMAELGVLR